ncbi:hypothetical protein [Neobacillus dielmonensis]|uniref:hypothetical protein n=1 Tax=Neobacillus dielmonensis TaxID=1347369 RepID=UPI0005A95442|nr:hypothetical protein [Neobacillus dielmonensis]
MANPAAKAYLEESNRRVKLAIDHLHAAKDFIAKAQAKDTSLAEGDNGATLEGVVASYGYIADNELPTLTNMVDNIANPPN